MITEVFIHALSKCQDSTGSVVDKRSVTVYPKKYAHGFVVLCFVVVMQSFIMNSHEVFIHIHQGCFAGTGAIVRLPQCQWSKPDGYGKISQCITTTKHSKAKTVCIFLGIYCISRCRILKETPNTFGHEEIFKYTIANLCVYYVQNVLDIASMSIHLMSTSSIYNSQQLTQGSCGIFQ